MVGEVMNDPADSFEDADVLVDHLRSEIDELKARLDSCRLTLRMVRDDSSDHQEAREFAAGELTESFQDSDV